MHQPSFSDIEYGLRKRITKREEFLKAMDEFIPWDEWVAYIEPYYPSGKRGRPPLGIEKMLRMYLLQCWFNLSDEGMLNSPPPQRIDDGNGHLIPNPELTDIDDALGRDQW